jgi:hypothetical protein
VFSVQQQQQQQQQQQKRQEKAVLLNPFNDSCKNAMSLSVPGVPAPCENFPHSSQLNFK